MNTKIHMEIFNTALQSWIEGDTRSGDQHLIQVDSWSWQVTVPRQDENSTDLGHENRKSKSEREPTGFEFNKKFDCASLGMLNAAQAGDELDVTLTLVGKPKLAAKLFKARITDYSLRGDGSSEFSFEENWVMSYGSIQISQDDTPPFDGLSRMAIGVPKSEKKRPETKPSEKQ